MKVANVKLKVVGVTFNNPDGTNRQNVIRELDEKSSIRLQREPTNLHDTNAIMVMSDEGQVGYIGRDYSAVLAPLMDSGSVFSAKVSEIGEYKNTQYIHIQIDEV